MAIVWQEVATSDSEQTLTNKTLTSPVLDTGVSGSAIKDEDNMASDSATHLATQQSIKKYVDDQVDTADAISELADTTIASVANGELLQYNSTGAVWENKTKVEAAIASTGANTDINSLTRLTNVEPADVSGENQAGTDFIIQGGAGTGSGAGGDVLINVCTLGGSGTSSNAAVTAVTVAEDKTVTLAGDLIVNGTTTTINTANLTVDDKNIILASIADGSTPSTTTAHGGGITLKAAADADATYFPDLIWKKDSGGGNTDGAGQAAGLTGWGVKNSRTSNIEVNHPLAIMDFETTADTAPSGTSAGIGSFVFNSTDDKLYVRISDSS
jgi:hypothetical protein